jgi:sugar phosphate permease
MADLIASARIRRIQRTALVLLVVGGLINYVDRTTLSVGLPLIRPELGLSLTQGGILSSAFLWTYAFSQLPAGVMIDRWGARLMLSSGLALWSLAQVLGGLVGGFRQFICARIFLGMGECAQFPSCARVVADWFHPRERGLATGVWNSSSCLGTAVSFPLLTVLMLHFGWRWMFALMGLAGLAVAAVIYWLHRDPGEVALTPPERDYLADGLPQASRVTWRDWKSLFCFRTTWGMIGGYFGAMYMLWIYTSWLPQYLEIELHVTVAKTGWIAAIPYLFGVVGSLVTGRICDVLLRRGCSPIASRKIPLVAAMFGVALLTLLTARTSSVVLAITYISATLFLLYGIACAAWTMATVVAPSRYTASLSTIQNFFGYLGAALAPIVTGMIAQRTGSFRSALLVGALVVVSGAIIHLVLVHKPVVVQAAPPGGTV